MTRQTTWRKLEGTRVETRLTACTNCGARDGVLRRHHCKDELELYCDWCERWTGMRIRREDLLPQVEPANPAHAAGKGQGGKLGQTCSKLFGKRVFEITPI
jgi:hypothetical protein